MMAALCGYAWPGNIRELQHVIERAVILTQGAELAFVNGFHPLTASPEPSPLATLEEVERAHILKALGATTWHISGKAGAAELLGLPPATLRSRLQKLGIVENPKNNDPIVTLAKYRHDEIPKTGICWSDLLTILTENSLNLATPQGEGRVQCLFPSPLTSRLSYTRPVCRWPGWQPGRARLWRWEFCPS